MYAQALPISRQSIFFIRFWTWKTSEKFSRPKKNLKHPFFKTGVVKYFNHGQTATSKRKLSHLINPNAKSILINLDGFDHNYGSICVFSYSKFLGNFLLHSRKICSTDIKKDAVPSKLRWGHRKQMRWPTLTINTVA